MKGCRVDHADARMPPPTPDLIFRMAKAFYDSMMEAGLVECDGDGERFADLDVDERHSWLVAAHRPKSRATSSDGARTRTALRHHLPVRAT